jgi:hypothetical protein
MPPTSIQAQAYLQGYLQKEASPRLRKWLNQFSDEERMARLDELRKNPAVDDTAIREYFLSYLNAPEHGKLSRTRQWTRGGKALTKLTSTAPGVDIDDYLVGLYGSSSPHSSLAPGFYRNRTFVAPERVVDEGKEIRPFLSRRGIPSSRHIQNAGVNSSASVLEGDLDHRLVLDPRGRVARMPAILPREVRGALQDAPRAMHTHTKGSGGVRHTLADYPSNKSYNALLEVAANLPEYASDTVRGKGFAEITSPEYLRGIFRTGFENSYTNMGVPAMLTQRSAEIAPGVFDVRGLDLAGITGNCMGNVCTSRLSAARVFHEGHRIALVAGDGKTPLGIETLQALLGKDTGPEALKRLNDVLATQGVPPKSTYESAMRAIRSNKAVGLIHTDAAGNLLDAVTAHNQNISPEAFRRGAAAVGLPSDIDIFKHQVMGGNMVPAAPRKVQDLINSGNIRIIEEGRPVPIRSLLQQISPMSRLDGRDRAFDHMKPALTDPRIKALPEAQRVAKEQALLAKVQGRYLSALGLRKSLLRAAATYGADQVNIGMDPALEAYAKANEEIYSKLVDAINRKDPRLASKGGFRLNPPKSAAPLEKVMQRVERLAASKAQAAKALRLAGVKI